VTNRCTNPVSAPSKSGFFPLVDVCVYLNILFQVFLEEGAEAILNFLHKVSDNIHHVEMVPVFNTRNFCWITENICREDSPGWTLPPQDRR
jgi:hypothetical protein